MVIFAIIYTVVLLGSAFVFLGYALCDHIKVMSEYEKERNKLNKK